MKSKKERKEEAWEAYLKIQNYASKIIEYKKKLKSAEEEYRRKLKEI